MVNIENAPSVKRGASPETPGVNTAGGGPVVSTDVGAIANSGVASNPKAVEQITNNAQQALAQNISLAKTGDKQALSQLLNTSDIYTNREVQNAYAYGLLTSAGYKNPSQDLVNNFLNGTDINGYNAKGGINYGVNLSENLGFTDQPVKALPTSVPKNYSQTIPESLRINDAAALPYVKNDVSNASALASLGQSNYNDIQNQLNAVNNTIDRANFLISASNPGSIGDLQTQLVKLSGQKENLEKQLGLFGSIASLGRNTLSKAKQAELKTLAGIAGIGKTSNQVIPAAFAEQQAAKRFNVNLDESLGVQAGTGGKDELVQGIGGPSPDYIGSPSEATAGFGSGFVDLSAADILGANKANINKLNSDISYLANTPGLSSITADFGGGVKKTYTPQQALGGILNEVTAREKASPQDITSNFGLSLQGNFEPTPVPLTSTQRQQQKQSFQQSQSDLLGNLATAKAKGITSLEITDAGGNIIGTTNPQDTTKARYDILKASLQGPVSVKGENTVSKSSSIPGKTIDLSNTDYSQLVDIGAAPKPQTPLEYLNYYGRRAERSFANPIEYVANQITGNLLPNNKELQFNISPTTSDIALGGVTQAAAKKITDTGLLNALGIKNTNTETRGPSTILTEETSKAASSVIQDPFGFAVEIPGEIGNVITQSKLAELGLKGAMAIGGKIGIGIERNAIQKAAESGLREGQLEFQVAKPKGSNIYEFEQGTAGKSGRITDVIPQEFGIGPKGEKVPQLNIPKEVKIPSPEGEGQAKVPLAYITPGEEGSTLIARENIQNVLSPNRILVKGVEPKLADVLGLKPVKNQPGLFMGEATNTNLPLIEGAAETGKIKPVTDFLEVYTKDFMKNPEIFGLFAREPRTLIPKNQNYPFQSFTRPNIIRYYEGYQGGFERAKYSPGLERRIALNELYPRIKTAATGYIDLTAFNPRDFSIVGVGSKGLDRYLTDLGLSPRLRKRTITPRKTTSGVSSDIAERYPLMKSGGLNQETTDLIRDIAYGYKPLPRGATKTKELTPLYPLPGLSEETKQRNRKATQQEDQALAFEVLGYPTSKSNIRSLSDIISFKKTPSESRTKTIQVNKDIASQFSGLNLLNPLKEHNQSKSKSALGLILSLKPAQGLRSRQDQRNNLLQDIIPIQTTNTSQRSDVGFKYRYQQAQKQQQLNKFADQLQFTVPAPPREVIPEFGFGRGIPRLYGLSTPGKKHGSRNIGSFFTYTVNPNKPGDIADVKYKSGKYVGNKPIKLKFSGSKLDSLLDTSEYSKYKRKSKKGLGF